MADDEALRDAALGEQRRHAEPDGVEAHEVDLLREQPARVVLAKARRLDERKAFEVGSVGLQIGARLEKNIVAHLVIAGPHTMASSRGEPTG